MPEVIINGPDGRLEGRYHHVEDKHAPVALVLHPHPKHGGTMNNKVCYNLYKSFVDQGFSTLRFNFRGVGKSQGEFDNGEGELADATAAMDWLQQYNRDAITFWVAGFSFGAWIALQLLMRRPEIERFITVSPPAGMYNFGFLSPCPRDGYIIQGNRDSIVEEPKVAKLVEELNSQQKVKVDYSMIDGADHFFRDHMDELVTDVNQFVGEHIGAIMERGVIRPDRRRRQMKKRKKKEV